MIAQDLLARLVAALDEAGVPYMLTGSYASSLHSIPRATRDIDVVIFPNREQLTRLIELLPRAEYYTDLEDALDALRRRGQFNVIDYATGWKVDFIIPPFDEFHAAEFERRQSIDVAAIQLTVVSPEDIVLAKLLWAKSERQLEDAATVISSQGARLDTAYVERWVRKLDVDRQWREACARATR